MSRATVEDCIRLLDMPDEEARREVRRLDRQEEESRQATYTYHACSSKLFIPASGKERACEGTVRTVRAADDRPDLCTDCYLRSKSTVWLYNAQFKVEWEYWTDNPIGLFRTGRERKPRTSAQSERTGRRR